MSDQFNRAFDRAAKLLGAAQATGRRAILGITGPPGSGKSTLAHALVAAIGNSAALAPMDGFHLANTVLEKAGTRAKKGALVTFDGYGYEHLIARLRKHDEQVVYAPDYSRDVEEAIAAALPVAREVDLVITEGNYLLVQDTPWLTARQHMDEVWFVDVPREVRQQRLIERHVKVGKSHSDAVHWSLGPDEENAKDIESLKPFADWII